jgi:N-acyl homoserine lactone hydrolase
MKMHLLRGGQLRMRKNIYLPTADRSETIDLPVIATLLRHEQGNVLFDTGCHPEIATNAEARWGQLTRVMQPLMSADDNVLSGLAELGLGASDIDLVVCSHLHPDHCGCNVFFKRATLVVHAREVEAARAADAETQGYLPIEWDHPMPTETISSERDLFGDGRIILLPLPGHTPGTMSALVELDRCGQFLLASDTISLSETIEQDVIPRNTWNVEVLIKSLAEIKRIAARGAIVLYSHDDRQWQTLRKGADFYD